MTSSLSSPSAPPPSLVRLTSLARLHAELPLTLQPSFDALASLHSALDVALAELDTATSIAQINSQTQHIKQLISQLQVKLTALQSIVQADPSNSSPASTVPPPPPPSSSAVNSPDDRDLAYASSLLAQHSVLAQSYTNQLRQRILSSRANLAKRSTEIRRQLLSSSSSPSTSSSTSVISSALRQADRRREFTASLHATHEMLSSSLALSSASLSSLSSSTSTLRSVQRQSAVYSGVVKSGSQVITKQMQRQRTDRLLIMVGLLCFTLVCLYITNKRLRIGKIVGGIVHLLMPSMGQYRGDSVLTVPVGGGGAGATDPGGWGGTGGAHGVGHDHHHDL